VDEVVLLKVWPPMAADDEEIVDEVADMPVDEPEVFGLSSSRSLIFENILYSYRCLSSSSWKISPSTKTLFLLTKLAVPALPEYSQFMPVQVFLKLL
jgi:hypothetical protein